MCAAYFAYFKDDGAGRRNFDWSKSWAATKQLRVFVFCWVVSLSINFYIRHLALLFFRLKDNRESRGRRAFVNSSRNIPNSSMTRFNGESPSPIQKLNGRRRVQFREIGRPCRKAQGTFPLRSIGFLAGARRIAESGIL